MALRVGQRVPHELQRRPRVPAMVTDRLVYPGERRGEPTRELGWVRVYRTRCTRKPIFTETRLARRAPVDPPVPRRHAGEAPRRPAEPERAADVTVLGLRRGRFMPRGFVSSRGRRPRGLTALIDDDIFWFFGLRPFSLFLFFGLRSFSLSLSLFS